MSDDAQAVVVEVFEAVGSSLDEFHLAMEAVVFGEAQHGEVGLSPVVEGGVQAQEAADVMAAGFGGLVPEAQKIIKVNRLRPDLFAKSPVELTDTEKESQRFDGRIR